MSGKSRWDYLKAIYSRYKKVSKPLGMHVGTLLTSWNYSSEQTLNSAENIPLRQQRYISSYTQGL